MQKALEQMNIKLNNVIRDITEKTGLTIIIAILKGERDPKILAQNRDWRNEASEVKSLEGNWREGQAFRDTASALWNAQNPRGDYLRIKNLKVEVNKQ